MARQDTRALVVPNVDNTDGAVLSTQECIGLTTHVFGWLSGKWELHGSLDGVHFDQIGMDLDVNGIVAFPEHVTSIRLHCQTKTGGADAVPTILLGMFFERD